MEEVYEKYKMRWSAGGDVIEFSHLCLEREKGASLGGQEKEMDSVVESKSQRPPSDPMNRVISLSRVVFTPPPVTGQTPGQEKPTQTSCVIQGPLLSTLSSPKGEEKLKKNRFMCMYD